MPKKYYVVWNGVETGVFDSWEDCLQQVKGYKDARYKSFNSREEAIEAYRGNPADHLAIFRGMARQAKPKTDPAFIPGMRPDAIAVDAACSRNPGPVEYRGVAVMTGQELFHVGPLAEGTNNIGEFLALVHALAWLDKLGRHEVPVYSDSRTGQSWVRKKKANTNLTPTPANAPIRDMIARAEAWLATHTVMNPVLKWNTEEWGEIPADFGRK